MDGVVITPAGNKGANSPEISDPSIASIRPIASQVFGVTQWRQYYGRSVDDNKYKFGATNSKNHGDPRCEHRANKGPVAVVRISIKQATRLLD